MENKYLEIIEREERRADLWYRFKTWTLVLLVVGAAAWAIVYITQHPNHKTEQHESDQHHIPL